MLSPLFTLKTATTVTLLMYLLNRCSPLKPRFTPRFTPHSIMLRSNPNRSFPSHCSSRLYSTSNSNSDDELPPTGPPINWYPGHISSAENQLEKVRKLQRANLQRANLLSGMLINLLPSPTALVRFRRRKSMPETTAIQF